MVIPVPFISFSGKPEGVHIMRRAICSGSFDPVTKGHVDIFERASRMVDELTVCVFYNVKKQSFFPVEKRVELLRESVGHIANIRVDSFSGLLSDYMLAHDINVIVRGLRSVTDFEYEQQSAQAIHHMYPELETIFMLSDPRHSFISSSLIREIAWFRGDVSKLVPECVERAIAHRLD